MPLLQELIICKISDANFSQNKICDDLTKRNIKILIEKDKIYISITHIYHIYKTTNHVQDRKKETAPLVAIKSPSKSEFVNHSINCIDS